MKRIIRLISCWLRTYIWAALLYLSTVAAFVCVHLLGGGAVREIGYALLLSGLAGGAALVISLLRLHRRLKQLDLALARLPEDAVQLPSSSLPTEELWRNLSVAYMKQYHATAARMQLAEREKRDYYTLWLHQIKTPLSALDLLAQSDAPVDRQLLRQELAKIEQYAAMALSYQRLDSIHRDLDLSDVALYPVCCQAVRRLRPLFQYSRISLTLTPFPGSALTDGKWLGVVLTQLLSNALKYTPAGGRITVSMTGSGLLTVADTGIGIRPEDVPRVFDRGFTGHTGRGFEKSTGIGLYLCKRICDELGHGISLTSELGHGASVTLDLNRRAFEANE